jgi:hypothetical protein
MKQSHLLGGRRYKWFEEKGKKSFQRVVQGNVADNTLVFYLIVLMLWNEDITQERTFYLAELLAT